MARQRRAHRGGDGAEAAGDADLEQAELLVVRRVAGPADEALPHFEAPEVDCEDRGDAWEWGAVSCGGPNPRAAPGAPERRLQSPSAPMSGADIPRYRPRGPSFLTVFSAQSTAFLYGGASPLATCIVCIRTLTRSNGWPTSTSDTPAPDGHAGDRCQLRHGARSRAHPVFAHLRTRRKETM